MRAKKPESCVSDIVLMYSVNETVELTGYALVRDQGIVLERGAVSCQQSRHQLHGC